MADSDALKNIPKEGFIKVTRKKNEGVSPSQRAALIRKGNEFFTSGNYELAKKIYLITGYTSGLTRMGDYYLEKNDYFEALRMYWIAPAPKKREELIQQFAETIRHWLDEDIKEIGKK